MNYDYVLLSEYRWAGALTDQTFPSRASLDIQGPGEKFPDCSFNFFWSTKSTERAIKVDPEDLLTSSLKTQNYLYSA